MTKIYVFFKFKKVSISSIANSIILILIDYHVYKCV